MYFVHKYILIFSFEVIYKYLIIVIYLSFIYKTFFKLWILARFKTFDYYRIVTNGTKT